MKKLLKVVFVIVSVFLVVGLLLPSEVYVERSQQINRPVEEVFIQVAELRNWEGWMPWIESDTTIVTTWSDKTMGVGGYYTWTSGMGGGRLEVLEFEENKRMLTEVGVGDYGVGYGHWNFESNSDGVNVFWGMSMDFGNNLFMRWMGLCMESMVGSEFEKGLKNLKSVCEDQ